MLPFIESRQRYFHKAVFRIAAKMRYRRGSDVSCLALQLWLQLLSDGPIHQSIPSLSVYSKYRQKWLAQKWLAQKWTEDFNKAP